MNAIKRVARAPWLLLGIWAAQILAAYLASRFVAATVASSMAGYVWLEDGHMLGAIAELLQANPAIGGAIVMSMIFATTVGALLWLFVGGAIFERYGGRAKGRESIAAGGRWAPAMLGLTLWALVVRGLVMGFGLLLAKLWSPLGLLLPLWFVLGLLAFDEARARVVLEGASVAHPRTSFGALRAVIRRPLLVLAGLALTLTQWALLAVALGWAAQAAFGGATLIAVRGLSLLTLALGLVRISAVIGNRAQPPEPEPAAQALTAA